MKNENLKNHKIEWKKASLKSVTQRIFSLFIQHLIIEQFEKNAPELHVPTWTDLRNRMKSEKSIWKYV